MAKQTIEQRIRGIQSSRLKAAFGPPNQPVDIRARWEKVKEDLPGDCAKIEERFGPIPDATLDDIPLEQAVHYACRDADGTFRVNQALDRMIDHMGLRECYQMDLAIVPMVARMQRVGCRIDKDHFRELSSYLSDLMRLKVQELELVTHGKTGPEFNPNSPKQTREFLFTRHGLNIRATKLTATKLESTNDKVLEALAFKHPACRIICDYRELSKLRDSFCVTLPLAADEASRIHPNLQLTRVSSGRLSCKEPNLLAIPVRTELAKLIREGFVAGESKVLGDWDLDQIEMREMAHQSGDPVMCQIFRDGKEDIHRKTGAMMFGIAPDNVTTIQRYAAKRIGFGIITGITEKGLSEQMALAGATVGGEVWDEQRCAEAIREYLNVYRGVGAFMDDCRAEARRFGYVRDRWGRIRYLPGVHSELPYVREEALRQSHSFKISASAQGTLKISMAAIWEWMKTMVNKDTGHWPVEPLLQVHDELLFELDDHKGTIEEVNEAVVWFMCNSAPMTGVSGVPIKAKGSTGPNWGMLKD